MNLLWKLWERCDLVKQQELLCIQKHDFGILPKSFFGVDINGENTLFQKLLKMVYLKEKYFDVFTPTGGKGVKKILKFQCQVVR